MQGEGKNFCFKRHLYLCMNMCISMYLEAESSDCWQQLYTANGRESFLLPLVGKLNSGQLLLVKFKKKKKVSLSISPFQEQSSI